MNKEECINCEWYGKPYWSIINPCANCNKRFNNKQVKNIKYSINFDKKELYKEIENLQQELNQKNKIIEEIKEYIKSEGVSYLDFAGNRCFCNKNYARYILERIEELEKGSEE